MTSQTHLNYADMYSEAVKEIEELKQHLNVLNFMLVISDEDRKKERGISDALQNELNAIDDFNALVESEVARSLSRKPS